MHVETILTLAGALAVAISDDGDDPILEPPPGSTPIWPRSKLTALFDGDQDLTRISELLSPVIETGAISTTHVLDRDWIDGWRQSVSTLNISDRLQIVPAGANEEVLESTQIAISMGLAFGTGEHPTTRLCLRWLAQELPEGTTVLDYGCGSGILALAALRLGARYAWATDIDDQALTAVTQNAQLNSMQEQIWIGPITSLPSVEVDVVCANILAGTLCDLAGSFAAHQRPGGKLVVSGILESQVDDVKDAYRPYYSRFEFETDDGWSRLAGERRA
jgi:ribosomal protein L11 methyltransferase